MRKTRMHSQRSSKPTRNRARSGVEVIADWTAVILATLVAYAIAAGLEIRALRIRSDEDMIWAISLGAFGMTTNWPDRLIRALLEDKHSK